jgi:hypothetical protein
MFSGTIPRVATLALLPLCASALLATGCAFTAKDQMKPGSLSPTLAPFLFKEEGDLILMTVGVGAARWRSDQPFVPLEVWVANKGVDASLSLNRESFYLMDTFGRRYGMAGIEEVRKLQQGLSIDRRMGSAEFNTFKFAAYHRIDSSFFPILGSPATVLHDRIELPRFGYIAEMLYFPRPEGDLLGGIFELHLVARQLPQEIFVVFEVPRS